MKYLQTEHSLLDNSLMEIPLGHSAADKTAQPRLDREQVGDTSLIWFLMGIAVALMLVVGFVFYSAA